MATPFATTSFDMTKLRLLSAKELCHLGDAFRTLSDVAEGLLSQGIYTIEDKRILNDAGDVLDGVNEFLMHSMEAIKSEAVRRSEGPVSKADARWLSYAHIRYEARFSEHPSGLAVVVAQAIVTEENADE